MEIESSFVFQADSDVVNSYYQSHPNFLIEFDNSKPPEYCIIYFSSNDLYYPNNEVAFNESIVKRNRFEWYKNRVSYGHKHIFLRDLKKQWYLTGINSNVDTPTRLIDFLRQETKGYKAIVLGSSAGGFMSIIVGQQLKAERIYSFNGQFEIKSLLNKSNPNIDPVLFRYKNNSELFQYYNSLNFIIDPSSIFYFHSNKSSWDIEQLSFAKDVKMNVISFDTNNHGVPFLKSNLPYVINLSFEKLVHLSGKKHHPLFFSLKMAGIGPTLTGVRFILSFVLNKIYIKTFQKWRSKTAKIGENQ